jgi:hypothetical protein
MCQILDLIESFVVRRYFCRIPTNALNDYFISMYRSLDKDNLVASAADFLIARHFPSDEEFLAGWERQPVYISGTAKCRHILESLEVAITTNNELVDMSNEKITIEHVMPQTLSAEWKDRLGAEADSIQSVYLHTVGNLTLTGMNEAMGNMDYGKKQGHFHTSHFALNSYFDGCNTWDENEIVARAQMLGSMAVKIWFRPEGRDSAIIDQDDPTGHKPVAFTLIDNTYPASTWRDVLLGACKVLAEYHGENFAVRAIRASGSKRQYINYTPDGMNTPVQIPGTELWIEANQSARSVLSTISQILNACGHDEDDFTPYWE